MGPYVLRVLEFQADAADAVIDRLILDTLTLDPSAVPGLVRSIAGRGLAPTTRHYLVATLWVDRDQMLAAIGDASVAVYQPAFAPYLGEAVVEANDLDVAWLPCDAGRLSTVTLFSMSDTGRNSLAPQAAERSSEQALCLVLVSDAGPAPAVLAGWAARTGGQDRTPTPPRVQQALDRVGTTSPASVGRTYQVMSDLGHPIQDGPA